MQKTCACALAVLSELVVGARLSFIELLEKTWRLGWRNITSVARITHCRTSPSGKLPSEPFRLLPTSVPEWRLVVVSPLRQNLGV